MVPRPVLDTLTFRGVPPSEEILVLARRLAQNLSPLLGPGGRCELALEREQWLTSGEATVEAKIRATLLGAPVMVFEERFSALDAIRAAFDSLEKVLRDVLADETADEAAGEAPGERPDQRATVTGHGA